ncbi:MAG: hypothetical protein D6812_12195 [Deltaproteobacteria bacterium]|nr:MAG: hypothetical protein D6812_12195 [Deltaproteobacteria bacterium]
MRRRRNRYVPQRGVGVYFRFDRTGSHKRMRGRRGGRPEAYNPSLKFSRVVRPGDAYARYVNSLLQEDQ